MHLLITYIHAGINFSSKWKHIHPSKYVANSILELMLWQESNLLMTRPVLQKEHCWAVAMSGQNLVGYSWEVHYLRADFDCSVG